VLECFIIDLSIFPGSLRKEKKGMEQDKFNDKYYPTVPKVKKKYNSPINHISEKDFVIIKYQ
jgi:hypothetical protein